MTALFDTLKVSQKLTAGGFTTEQAHAATEAFSEALRADLATKADLSDARNDIQKLKLELDSKIDATTLELRSKIESTKLELESKIESTKLHLEAKFHEGRAEIIKWVAGIVTVQTLALLGAVFGLLKMLSK